MIKIRVSRVLVGYNDGTQDEWTEDEEELLIGFLSNLFIIESGNDVVNIPVRWVKTVKFTRYPETDE